MARLVEMAVHPTRDLSSRRRLELLEPWWEPVQEEVDEGEEQPLEPTRLLETVPERTLPLY